MTEDKENDTLKDFVLRDIYYNKQTGFQNQKRTYEAAKKRLGDIKPAYVKSWFDRQRFQQLKPQAGFNSYIVDAPNKEIAVDLADFSKNGIYNRGYRYIFIAVDAFTKFCWAVPIKSKDASECAKALKEVINSMGTFKILYTDGEPAFESNQFIRVLNKYNIHHIISSSPSGMAERMVKTIKDKIAARIKGLQLDHEKWIDLLEDAVYQYNREVHRTIGMSPKDAQLGENRAKVLASIRQHAVFNRTYEPISIGDTVRTYIKKTSFSKGTDSRYSETLYKVMEIHKNTNNDIEYTLNNSKTKAYLRHELRLVKTVQDHTTMD